MFAELIPDFSTIKKRAKNEKIPVGTEDSASGGVPQREQKKQTDGIMSIGSTLGRLLRIAAIVAAVIEPLMPVLTMLGSILRVIGMFLMPLIVPILRMLTPVLKGISSILNDYLDFFDDFDLNSAIHQVGQTISNALRDTLGSLLPGSSNPTGMVQGIFQGGSNLAQGNPMSPSESPGVIGSLMTAGARAQNTIVNVMGITDESTAREMERGKRMSLLRCD